MSNTLDQVDTGEFDREYRDYATYLNRRTFKGALYRRFWLYPKLARHIHGMTLDIGCGIGDFLAFRKKKIVGVDINPYLVKRCQKRGLDARLMEIDVLPFDADDFDSVVLDNVLEHIASPKPLLTEIYRVIRPGGTFLLGVPGVKGYASDPDHKIYYDKKKLDDLLTGFGFRPQRNFYTPIQSETLNRNLRQYCLYATYNAGQIL